MNNSNLNFLIVKIFNLPKIHEKIINYLDTTSISNLRLVNKFFKKICQYRPILEIDLIYGDIFFTQLLKYSIYHLKTLVKKCKRVKKLSIKFKYDISKNTTFIVSRHLAQLIFKNLDCKYLKILELKCEEVGNNYTKKPISFINSNIIKKISKINTLIIESNISTKFINYGCFDKVESLTIDNNRDNYENGCFWNTIIDNFENLKELDISGSCIEYVDKDIIKLNKLEILIMYNCYFEIFPVIISELKNLKYVELSNDGGSYYDFTCMRKLKNLKSFIINDFVVDFNNSDEKLMDDYNFYLSNW